MKLNDKMKKALSQALAESDDSIATEFLNRIEGYLEDDEPGTVSGISYEYFVALRAYQAVTDYYPEYLEPLATEFDANEVKIDIDYDFA